MLTTENTVKSMLRHMNSLNLEVLDYLLLGRLKIYPVKAMRAKSGADHALQTLEAALLRQWEQDLIIIDSITTFVAHSTPEQVIAFFEECKSYCDQGMTIALIAHAYAFNDTMLVRIASMCDVHLRLALENVGDRLIKTIEVSKIRGAQMSTGNIISFDVEPGVGMKIIPFSKARA